MSLRSYRRGQPYKALLLFSIFTFLPLPSESAKKKETSRNLDPEAQGDMKEFKNELDNYLAGPKTDLAPEKSISGMGSVYKVFKQAADEFNLPVDLLLAISLRESGFSMKTPGPSSKSSGWGMMGLGTDMNPGTIQKASELLKVNPEKIRKDPLSNVRAGAVLIDDCRKKTLSKKKQSKANIKDYQAVLKCYSGSKDKFMNQLFADEIFSVLSTGYTQRIGSGELITIISQEDLKDFEPAQIP